MLIWSDWPARRRPAQSALAALLIVMTVGLIATIEPLLALLGALLLVATTAEVLLPTRYELGGEGLELRGATRTARRSWRALGAWRTTPEGFFVEGAGRSPFLKRHRGLSLRCPGREQPVRDLLAQHLGPEAGAAR